MGNVNDLDQDLQSSIQHQLSIAQSQQTSYKEIVSPDEGYATVVHGFPKQNLAKIKEARAIIASRQRSLQNVMKSVKTCPIYRLDGGIFYKGQWSNCLPNGTGIAFYEDGSYYEGDFSEGELEGPGLYIFSQGESGVGRDRTYYLGNWKKSQFHGQGTLVHWNLKYEGEWLKGIRNGKGIELQTEMGYKFDGQFVNGYKEGKGVYSQIQEAKTLTYDGLFQKGKFHQLGAIFYNGHPNFYGHFIQGQKHGLGRLTTAQGTLQAWWKKGKVCGVGVYQTAKVLASGEITFEPIQAQEKNKIIVNKDQISQERICEMRQFTFQDFQKHSFSLEKKLKGSATSAVDK